MSYLKNLGNVQLAILFLILANIIWGAGFPIYKWSLEVIPPFTFAFIRFYIGALIIFPFVYKKLSIAREDYLKTILLGLISVTILIPMLFLGLQLTPSINAPIIIATGPIILIFASFVLLKEKIKSKTVIGTLISLSGALIIILRPLLEEGFSGGLLGNILILGATICSVAQAILLKKLTARNDPLTLTFWAFLIGSIPLVPLVVWESQNFNIITDMNIQGLIGILYGVILAAAAAHIFLAYGIKFIKASEIGVYTYLDPIATIIVAIPLLGESLTVPYVIGAVFVFIGILIAEGKLNYHLFTRLKSV